MLKQHCFPSSFIRDTNVIPLIPRRSVGDRITALVIVLVLVSLAAASGMKLDLAGSQSSAAPRTAENPNASAEFVYFPGQYVNQASEPTEHIQAF